MKTARRVMPWMMWALASVTGCNSNELGGGPGDNDLAGPQPILTEFLAKNQAGLTDEDGQAADWIEIHNPHTVPLDLGGYHLTDSKANPNAGPSPTAPSLLPALTWSSSPAARTAPWPANRCHQLQRPPRPKTSMFSRISVAAMA